MSIIFLKTLGKLTQKLSNVTEPEDIELNRLRESELRRGKGKMLWAIILMAALIILTGWMTVKKAAPEGDVSIVINPLTRRLVVYADGIPYHAYPVAIGKRSTPTPIGEFVVAEKHVNWGTGFGTRWIGLNVPWGMYGIHGTNKPGSIGTPASHGCIRMLNRHVEELYSWVKVGTKVTILGHALGGLLEQPRALVKGHTGGDVLLVQYQLRAAGHYNGPCNGKFGPATESAVRSFERANGMAVDGIIGRAEYEALGLTE